MIYRYLAIVVALAATLAGLQVPGFIQQYEQRAEAHLAEVSANLSGFQKIADRRHGGSIEALIAHHARSTDATFRDEAEVIGSMIDRRNTFQKQVAGLSGSLSGQVAFLAGQADRELVSETIDGYRWVITLDRESLICGGIALVIGLGLSDGARLLLLALFRRTRTAST